MAASVLGLTDREINRRYSDILAFADIGDFIHQPVKFYSSGMYARLAFAVAAHVDADILIIDEILAVGDAAFNQKCIRFIREFKERGTIILVSHDLGAVNSLCDRVMWIDNGSVAEIGPAKAVCQHYLLTFLDRSKVKAIKAARDHHPASVQRPGSRERAETAPSPGADAAALRGHHTTAQVMEFDPSSGGFGEGGAIIEDVWFEDEEGDRLKTLQGGEVVTLRIRARAQRLISQPIIGFLLRDRLGQNLFGDNTWTEDAPPAVQAGMMMEAAFSFQIPLLPQGDYSVTVALADGTPQAHTQLVWLYEALITKVQTSSIRSCLVGIPMLDIDFAVQS